MSYSDDWSPLVCHALRSRLFVMFLDPHEQWAHPEMMGSCLVAAAHEPN